jgi:hypothetical protein
VFSHPSIPSIHPPTHVMFTDNKIYVLTLTLFYNLQDNAAADDDNDGSREFITVNLILHIQ